MHPGVLTRTVWAVGLLAALASGCTKADRKTSIIVEVWSDIPVPAGIDSIAIEAQGPTHTSRLPFALGAVKEGGKETLPLRGAVVPRGKDMIDVEVRAIGLLGAKEVVRQEAILSFVPGEMILLKLFLGADCRGVSCTDTRFTCAGGACDLPKKRPQGSAPPYKTGQPFNRPDAFVPLEPPSGTTLVSPSSGGGGGASSSFRLEIGVGAPAPAAQGQSPSYRLTAGPVP